MALLLGWLLFTSVQIAATMSPGPAFVVSVRNSMIYSRRIGVYTAFGLALGVMMHVVFVLAGLSFLVANSVFLYSVIRYAGAAYLIYIGIKSLRSRKRIVEADNEESDSVQAKSITRTKAMWVGFLTNLLNPKAVIFFTAIFTQFISPDTQFVVVLFYGCTSVLVEFLWFTGVAIILTNISIKRRFMGVMHWVERSCGGLMVALGVKLALSK